MYINWLKNLKMGVKNKNSSQKNYILKELEKKEHNTKYKDSNFLPRHNNKGK